MVVRIKGEPKRLLKVRETWQGEDGEPLAFLDYLTPNRPGTKLCHSRLVPWSWITEVDVAETARYEAMWSPEKLAEYREQMDRVPRNAESPPAP